MRAGIRATSGASIRWIVRWAAVVLVVATVLAPADAAPPVVPGNPSPAPGAVTVPTDPDLCVDVSDPDGGTVQVTFRGREVLPPGDDFTVVVIPDPQNYALTYPDIYRAQMQWIADNRDRRRIAFVSGLGDMTNNGDTAGQEVQWGNASDAFAILEAATGPGYPDGIPYGMCVGNHDNGGSARSGGDEGATTRRYTGTFGQTRFCGGTCSNDAARACRMDADCVSPGACGSPGVACRSYVGGRFDFGDPARYPANRDDHYEVFRGSGMDFVAVHLEWDEADSPERQAVLSWMEGVLADAEPERRALIAQHYLIPTSGTPPAFTGMGQAVWDRVRDDPDVFLMTSGHLDQANRRLDVADDGHPVHTLVSDYQGRPYGGRGWLRLLTFQPRQGTIHVQTLSPWVNYPALPAQEAFITGHVDDLAPAQNDVVLSYAMDGGGSFADIATVAVDGGGRACVTWPGLRPGGTYQWTARVADGTSTVRGGRWLFDVGCGADGDCDDGAVCTADRCDLGQCRHEPVAGCCLRDADCADGNPCTDDACDPAAAACRFVANTDPCDDGDACTDGDTCLVGACAGAAVPGCCGIDAECDDGSSCTADACTPPNVAALDFDGVNDRVDLGTGAALNDHGTDSFTVEGWFRTDTAAAGYTGLFRQGRQGSFPQVAVQLAPSAPFDRIAVSVEATTSPYTAAQVDSDPATFTLGAWHHVAAVVDRTAGAPQLRVYLDGTLVSTKSGSAWGAWPVTMTDGAMLGATRGSGGTPTLFFDGALDEWRVWSGIRTAAQIRWGMHRAIASATGLVARWALDEGQGAAAADSAGGTVATVDGATWRIGAGIADLGPGACAHGALTGPACDDGDACSDGDVCAGGKCVGGAAVACDDGDACNGPETCDGGLGCIPGAPLACDDGDACNGVETCDATVGCVPGTAPACDDGDACNGVETCDGGLGCIPGALLACDDGDACNGVETCDAAVGCVPGTAPACDDGDACNGVETCDAAWGCLPGAPLACDDGNVCTDEACDPVTGCIATANTAPCDDGAACTVTACRSGACAVVGMAPGCCAPGVPCLGSADLCDPGLGLCVAVTCRACGTDGDCGAAGNHCATLFSGAWCLVGCRDGTCPADTTCRDLGGDRPACVPDVGDCRCVAEARVACDGDALAWFDSCGRIGDVAEDCGGRGCLAGACCPTGTRADGGGCRPDVPDGGAEDSTDPVEDVPATDPGAADEGPADPSTRDTVDPDPGLPTDLEADRPDDPVGEDVPALDPGAADVAGTDAGTDSATDGVTDVVTDAVVPDLPLVDVLSDTTADPGFGDPAVADTAQEGGRDGALPEVVADQPPVNDTGLSSDPGTAGRSGGGCAAGGAPSSPVALALVLMACLGMLAGLGRGARAWRTATGSGNPVRVQGRNPRAPRVPSDLRCQVDNPPANSVC